MPQYERKLFPLFQTLMLSNFAATPSFIVDAFSHKGTRNWTTEEAFCDRAASKVPQRGKEGRTDNFRWDFK